MDHRRKHAGHKSIAEVDHESGDARSFASYAHGSRRSRLSTLAVLSLGLLVTFVGIITVVHFSHVNTLHTGPAKTVTSGSVLLRRESIETGGTTGGTAAAAGATGGDNSGKPDGSSAAGGGGGATGGGAGSESGSGSGSGSGFAELRYDDDYAGGGDYGSAALGEADHDGAANDDPVDKGEKDDDGAANDQPIDKGEKDDDGAANDQPVDKGDKDDDGAANDQPVDKGDKDDDGAANDQPVDKGDKDEEEPEGDPLALPAHKAAAVGEVDDDGAQHDTPGDLDEDDDGAAVDGTITGAAGDAAGGGNGKLSGGLVSEQAAGDVNDDDAAERDAGAVSERDGSDPDKVDEVTDYDGDDGDVDLYVEVDPDLDPDYDANQDMDLQAQEREQQQQVQQLAETQEQRQQQAEEAAKREAEAQVAPAAGISTAVTTAAAVAAAAAVPSAVAGDACGPLSRELLQQWAENNTVLLTFTNSVMFRNFGPTWLHHVQKAGIKYWVLAVADNETAQLVRSRGADHCFLVHENEIDDTAAAFKWGSKSWQLHTWQKVLVVRHVHHLGFHVINSDLDVVWLRNPLHHFLIKYPLADYWVSMDPITTANPIGDDGPELGVSTHHYMNTGVYFLRQTPGGRALIDKWYDIREAMQRAGFHDQDGLYQYLKGSGQEVDAARRITRVVDDGKTALAQLPATLFQNGYSHCINQIHKLHGLQPFEVHFVWVWGGNTGKISRMREQMYYIDPPSYYSDGTFMSFDVLPIQDPAGFNNWTDTEAMVQTHLGALDSQLTDTWHGLALAALTGRTLILPKMKCFCIQNWFENPQCRLPGEPHTTFPLAPACPADYVFNMDPLASFNLSGRPVPVREFSFLDNERTPAAVKERPLVVIARRDVSAASRDGDTLTIPAGLKSDPLLEVLRPFVSPEGPAGSGTAAVAAMPPKRLHFANPRLAFGGWSDPRVGAEFEAHVAGLPVRWCCRPDAVAKQHGKELHHQLTMHAAVMAAGAEVAAGAGNGSGAAGGASRRRLRLW